MKNSSAKTNTPRAPSKLRGNLLLALISTLLCLLAAEVGLRVIQSRRAPITLRDLETRRRQFEGREVTLGHIVVASENPGLVYELIPNLDVQWWGLPVRINSWGFRDDEFATNTPPETVRIAVLGDSSAFGWKVRKEDSYPDALEQILNRFSSGPTFEVMNFAVPGYNTAMERELLRAKVLRVKPDLVVLHFEVNDMDLPNFVKKPVNHWRLNRCYLWEFLSRRRSRWSSERANGARAGPIGLADLPMKKDEHGFWRYTAERERIPPELTGMVGEENCKAAISDIKRMCEGKGIPAVFVLNPISVDKYSETSRAIHDPLFAAYAQAARGAGFAIADPSMTIREFLEAQKLESRDLWIDPQNLDGHPAPPRLSLIALEIAKVLLANDMLPPGGIDRTRHDQLLAAFVRRAVSQWASMERGKPPQLAGRAITILPADPESEATYLGEGWYPREVNSYGEVFRWTKPKAQLLLPPTTRLVIEVGTGPRRPGPSDQAFILDGQVLRSRFTRRNGRAWFEVSMPESAAQKRDNPLRLVIKSKRVERLPPAEKRDLGLLVYRVMIETP
ncbi:hypothetical protein AMJ85_04715 [candidate division BRC1 bacterium SM23_51]|nr:MAG: hypothetical protein AMJ85_04715 [candidate division BRC1 bacterium SM23_51]